MTPDEMAAELRPYVRRHVPGGGEQFLDQLLELAKQAPVPVVPEEARAEVILFKSSGKYYTAEEWRIPVEVPDYSNERGSYTRPPLLPSDMKHSPDFRRIDLNGAVLVPSQEPWGYPHLIV